MKLIKVRIKKADITEEELNRQINKFNKYFIDQGNKLSNILNQLRDMTTQENKFSKEFEAYEKKVLGYSEKDNTGAKKLEKAWEAVHDCYTFYSNSDTDWLDDQARDLGKIE